MAYSASPERYEFFATCLPGAETLLSLELETLGIRKRRPLKGGVTFFGRPCDVERVCLESRLAGRVSLTLGRIGACDADELYRETNAVAWEDILAEGASVGVRARGTNAALRNTHFVEQKTKDAICDRLLGTTGKRPEVDPHKPDAAVEVRIRDGKATLSLDLSGGSLHARPYLAQDSRENNASQCARAAVLLAVLGWREKARSGAAFFDPCCDDGILAVEAASEAADCAPNLLRSRWGFEGWRGHDAESFARMLDEADGRFEKGRAALLGLSCDAARSALSGAYAGLPDNERVSVVGVSASSPHIARAREHVKGAGLRMCASIESNAHGEARTVEDRVGVIAAGRGAALIVATLEPLGREHDARHVSEIADFMAAVSMAPAGSSFAFCGSEDIAARFGRTPATKLKVGKDHTLGTVQVFDTPPAKRPSITVPDPQGGADHLIEVNCEGTADFAARLFKRAREARKQARRTGVSCYRVYDADLPDYAAAIDIYAGAAEAAGKTFVHIAEYQAPSSVDPERARMRFEDILTVAPVVLGVRPDRVFSKVRGRAKGGSQYAYDARRAYVTHVEEGGCLFEIDLASYLDTGLFLDHRDTRATVGEMAKGCRFLNLFAYTGSASVYAAAGGASEVTTVDLSNTYLDWARRNMALNGFEGNAYSFEKADCLQWITDARRKRRTFDLIFVDPPTFSNSKSMGKRTWDVQRDHVELLVGVSRLLARGGCAMFSCNLRSFKPDTAKLESLGVRLEDVTQRTIPWDFKRNPKIHRCYLLTRIKSNNA